MGLYRRRWPNKSGQIKTSKTWWMSFVLDGIQRCETTGTTNRRLAQKIFDRRKGEISEGRFRLIPAKSPMLKAWSDQFLKTIRHENTRRVYTSCVKMLRDFFEESRLSNISVSRIEEYKQVRLADGAGPATINRNLAVLRRMLKLAYRRRLIAQNPFDEVEFLNERQQRRQPHVLTFEEETRLLAVE